MYFSTVANPFLYVMSGRVFWDDFNQVKRLLSRRRKLDNPGLSRTASRFDSNLTPIEGSKRCTQTEVLLQQFNSPDRSGKMAQ